MVSFFEVVTFFGAASFLAWLEFLALLNEFAAHIPDPSVESKSMFPRTAIALGRLYNERQARNNLIGINDYFLMSFVCFAFAIVAEFLYHNDVWIGPYFIGSLFHAPTLMFIVVVSFPTGIVTLLIPMWYIRSILRGDRSLVDRPRNVSESTGLFWLAVVMIALNWSWYTMSPFAHADILFIACVFMVVLGVYHTLKGTVVRRDIKIGQYLIGGSILLWPLANFIIIAIQVLSHIQWDWSLVIALLFLVQV